MNDLPGPPPATPDPPTPSDGPTTPHQGSAPPAGPPPGTPPSEPPPPEAPVAPAEPSRGAGRGVALMLAVAAVLAAAIAARASIMSSQASGSWQAGVREEVKHGAAMIEDVRFVYNDEAPVAFRIAAARIRAEEYRQRAERATGDVRAVLLLEARAQEDVAETLLAGSEIASSEEYATESGGFDLGRRLADNRNRYPDLVALDPEAKQAEGDERSDAAVLMIATTVPVALAFLFGALAQAHPRRRRPLLGAGWTVIGVAVVLAVVVEVVR